MNDITLPDCRHVRLEKSIDLSSFDCGDADLNEFLSKDSLNYYKDLLAVTNLFYYGDDIVCFYSVSNDRVSYEDFPSKNQFNKFCKLLPFAKRHLKSLPAVKIGRLGVNRNYQNKKIGTQILDLIKMSFITKNKTGCRFITVDAYNNKNTLNFYEKNNFNFFPTKKPKGQTVLMYFDLMEFVNAKTSLL